MENIPMEELKNSFETILGALHAEFAKLRTGRANPAMIEDIKVDYYGTKVPVKQVGSITVPEPRQLLVQPWDKNALAPMEKAIRDSGLGLNPTNEGDKLRIVIPQLNEERRRELTKIIGRVGEEARIKLRNFREDAVKHLKKQEETGEIPEDEKFRTQEKLQALVEEYNKKIKELSEIKEKEIMTV